MVSSAERVSNHAICVARKSLHPLVWPMRHTYIGLAGCA